MKMLLFKLEAFTFPNSFVIQQNHKFDIVISYLALHNNYICHVYKYENKNIQHLYFICSKK